MGLAAARAAAYPGTRPRLTSAPPIALQQRCRACCHIVDTNVLTEDLPSGAFLDGVRFVNPFAPAFDLGLLD